MFQLTFFCLAIKRLSQTSLALVDVIPLQGERDDMNNDFDLLSLLLLSECIFSQISSTLVEMYLGAIS